MFRGSPSTGLGVGLARTLRLALTLLTLTRTLRQVPRREVGLATRESSLAGRERHGHRIQGSVEEGHFEEDL